MLRDRPTPLELALPQPQRFQDKLFQQRFGMQSLNSSKKDITHFNKKSTRLRTPLKLKHFTYFHKKNIILLNPTGYTKSSSIINACIPFQKVPFYPDNLQKLNSDISL